jgi:hypothetical protein
MLTRRDAIAAAALLALALPAAAQPEIQLSVTAKGELPGFRIEDASAYLAAQMRFAQVTGWTFVPQIGTGPDRVEWSFQLNPYASGGVRQVVPIPGLNRLFGNRRMVSAELRLYLGNEYQTMVSGQAAMLGGAGDADLAALIAGMTQNLLGEKGAYRAIDMQPGRHGNASP